ncbi:MAG TPA: TrmJ/YjtD family RNA methyltransferase [Terriglobales bacterium]|nr:TrmJ/YjtD family RNA methyltransferase [Terriglobales bacterium]
MSPARPTTSGTTLENLRVVLVATRNPLNIGAAARAMSNFGTPTLHVVHPYEVAFREARSAVGAADLLARAKEYSTVAEAVADCSLVVGTTAASRRDVQIDLRRLEEGATTIIRQLKTGPVALLFGSEKVGLSNEDMSHCHWLMRIPTRSEHGSMNLAQAVAVCLYELVRKRQVRSSTSLQVPRPKLPLATAGEIERLTSSLYGLLDTVGYVKPKVARATEEKLRRLLRRLDLNAADAELFLGMFRQIQWKLSTKNKL